VSPDPGSALITGVAKDANVFKIPSLRAIRRTAPYFHDNSARTLEDAVAHYARLFRRAHPGIADRPYDAGSGRHGRVQETAGVTVTSDPLHGDVTGW
jgi:cytochrome c peroxidase